MPNNVAVVGAGVSGLTCAVVCAERGWRTEIFAERIGTTSLAAAAMWYPYDAGPPERAIPWALQTYRKLEELALEPETGVSMITLRMFSRNTVIEIPEWAVPLGAARIRSGIPAAFVSGFTLVVRNQKASCGPRTGWASSVSAIRRASRSRRAKRPASNNS